MEILNECKSSSDLGSAHCYETVSSNSNAVDTPFCPDTFASDDRKDSVENMTADSNTTFIDNSNADGENVPNDKVHVPRKRRKARKVARTYSANEDMDSANEDMERKPFEENGASNAGFNISRSIEELDRKPNISKNDTSSDGMELELSNMKAEIDTDNKLIVMNKHTKFNVRVKPDTSNFRHKCPRCPEVFQWPHKLKKHVAMVHEGKYPHQCTLCGKPFERLRSLNEHMTVHSDARPFKCDICSKAFKFKANLNKHVKETHVGDIFKFQCEYCQKVFKSKEKLIIHFVVHEEEKKLVCPICGKRFHRKNNLREHQVIHSTEKNFECPDCGLCFNRKYALKIHSRNHMEVKPYRCELCPSSFTQLYALKNHVRRHTGEKPYQCLHCDRSFAQQSTLQVHTKRHTGEKNFTCGICQQSFVIKRRLQEHIRTHTGEKPYHCELCPFKAAISSGLKLHMKTHFRQMQRQVDMKIEQNMAKTEMESVEEISVFDTDDVCITKVSGKTNGKAKGKGCRKRTNKKPNKTSAVKTTKDDVAQTQSIFNDHLELNGYHSNSQYRSPTLRAMLETKQNVPKAHFEPKGDFVLFKDVSVDAGEISKSIEILAKSVKAANNDSTKPLANVCKDISNTELDQAEPGPNTAVTSAGTDAFKCSVSKHSEFRDDKIGEVEEVEEIDCETPEFYIEVNESDSDSEIDNYHENTSGAEKETVNSKTKTVEYEYTICPTVNGKGIDDSENVIIIEPLDNLDDHGQVNGNDVGAAS